MKFSPGFMHTRSAYIRHAQLSFSQDRFDILIETLIFCRNQSLLRPIRTVLLGHRVQSMCQEVPRQNRKVDTPTLIIMKPPVARMVVSTATHYLGRRQQNSMKMLVSHGPFSKMLTTSTTIHWPGFLNSRKLYPGLN